MTKHIRWLTRTAMLLALLIVLQWATKPLGQYVTGSCVNLTLAVAALCVGMGSGAVLALVSPVLAYLLGIAPQLLTVPAIMVGNLLFVCLLAQLYRTQPVWRAILAWVLAAAGKAMALYLLVAQLFCGVLADSLLAAGLLKGPMLQTLPTMFSLPQLVTALIGGGLALLVTPVLRKVLSKTSDKEVT